MALNELTSQSPYLDDYDASKNYVGIAAVPGCVVQAREFTQSQTILRDHLKRIGDAVLTNGTIVSGCAILVSGSTVTIDAGQIYLNGMVRNIGVTQVSISGSGTEYIGARVRQTIVTEEDDPSLKDPATGYENAGKPGAHRIKEVVQFVVLSEGASSDEIAVVYTLVDGEVKKDTTSTTVTPTSSTPVTDTQIMTTTAVTPEVLAKRTFDENGSYKVSGLQLVDKGIDSVDGIDVMVSNGKAYVNGYEVNKSTATTLTLGFGTDVRTIRNEPIEYNTGTLEYVLRFLPAKRLIRVTSLVQVTESVDKGIAGGTDMLSSTPVDNIVSVTSSNGNVVYNVNTDYYQEGNGINWSPDGNEPANGSTYKVTYQFWRTQTIGTDVVLSEGWDDDSERYLSKLKFNNPDTYPVPGSTTHIDYEVYLARVDTITLDQNGEFGIIRGVPELESQVSSPINQDDTKLIIGTVLIYQGYNSSVADSHRKRLTVSSYNNKRLSQADLQTVKRRIDDLEYNVAMTDLDTEAAENESATSLRGILTDGFIGLTKADIGHDDFNCTIDLDNNYLSLPVSTNIVQMTPNLSTSSNMAQFGSVLMSSYTDKVVLNQPYATSRMLVNQYHVWNNPLCVIKLSPAVDNWIETTKVTVNKTATVSTTLRRWWYHKGASWAEEEKQKWLQLTGTTGEQLVKSNYSGTTVTKSSEITLDEAILYMRQRKVYVTGTNFAPNADNIECYFNGIPVALTPNTGYLAGTGEGTVKANTKGGFKASFYVPADVPCGIVNVVLKNATNSGEATYTAQGRHQVLTTTVLTTKTVVKTRDPLAQSFQFDTDTILTKVGLYFATKDSTKNLVIQVRNMINGYPGTEVYDEVYVDTDDVKVSTTAALETTINFSQPVYCKADTAYCICVLTDSDEYEAWTATLGERDVVSNAYVSAQPYVAGVLFSSSNANTWTAHQATDLKFKLYAAEYSTDQSVLQFNNITVDTMNHLLVAAESIDYKNNGVFWYYRIQPTDDWLPIDTYDDRELPSLATTLQLKVEINTTRNTSPILAGDVVNLISFIDGESGTYISRTVTLDHGTYNQAFCSFEAYKPVGTTIRVYYSTGGSNWIEYTNPTTTVIDAQNEISRYEYIANVGANVSKYKVRIDMSTNNVMTRPLIRKLVNVMRTV